MHSNDLTPSTCSIPVDGFRAEAGQELARGRRHSLASFETRPLGAPQDEDTPLIVLRRLVGWVERKRNRLSAVVAMGFGCSTHPTDLQILDIESCDWV